MEELTQDQKDVAPYTPLGVWQWAVREPSRPALVTQSGERLSFGELAAAANQFTRGLRSVGCRRGDTIAVMLPNGPEIVELLLAATQGGLYITMLNYHLKPSEIAYVLEDCGAQVFIADSRYSSAAAQAVADLASPPERLYAVGSIPGFLPISTLLEA